MGTIKQVAGEHDTLAESPAPDVVARAQGAWQRQGLAVGTGAFREMSDVWWLQSGPYFADLRRPRDAVEGRRTMGGNMLLNALNAARAFSGVVGGEGDRLSWYHDLDTMPVVADHHDAAVVLRYADLLMSAGDGYVERWQSACSRGTEGRVLERRSRGSDFLEARIVQVGNDAIAVWAAPASGGARLRRGDDGAWALEARVGAQPLSAEVVSSMPGRIELVSALSDAGRPVASDSGKSEWNEVA
jgi:hypothetical protein